MKRGYGFMALLAYSATLPVIFSAPKRFRSSPKVIFIDTEKIAKAEAKRQRKAAKRLK